MSNILSQAPFGSGESFDLTEIINPRNLGALTGVRFDDADSAFFLRQLTQVYTKTYDIKYAELKARKFIPVDNSVNPGALSFVWHQYDKKGQAKVVTDYANDFPNVEFNGKEFGGKLVSLGASYQYSMQDLRSAKMAGMPLETRKAEQARFVIESLVEYIAVFGFDGTNGTPPATTGAELQVIGFAKLPDVPLTTTTLNWIGGSATVTQILADVNARCKAIVDTSLGIHKPDTLVLPTAVYTYLATTPRSPTFTDDTMLQYILKQSPWLKTIEDWATLNTAGLLQDGSTVGGRAIFYEKNPDNCALVIAQEFEQLPPQVRGMGFVIPVHARIGGVKCPYPKSMAYLDGMAG